MSLTEQGKKEVKKDLKMTPEKLRFLNEKIIKMSNDVLMVLYNQIRGYNNKYFRVENYYFKGYMIKNVIDKKWSKK